MKCDQTLINRLDREYFEQFYNVISESNRWRVNGNGWKVSLHLSYHLISRICNEEKKFMFKMLQSWRDDGLIELKNNHIIIHRKVAK